tara:strand:+ start:1120 stop:1368 length:249 start_codon:yes stop_codon:yes gene_type:complete
MSNKLSQEEVAKLKSYQLQNTEIALALGNIEIREYELKKQKEEIFKKYETLQKEQVTTAGELEKKYGSGNIDLETGEISSIE